MDKDWTPVGEDASGADKPFKELRGLLGDALTSENLVVLTGLGTSRCIEGAPSMDDLWDAMKAASGEEAFQAVCTKTGYKWEGERGNFEYLLSRCVLHSRVSPSDKSFADFLKTAESTVIKKCRFVSEGQELPMHEEFLRKISRRPTTKARTKIFTTNYDLAFETAAEERVSVPYTELDENDFLALFSPSGRVQGPKIREAIRSLRLVKLVEKVPALKAGLKIYSERDGLLHKERKAKEPFLKARAEHVNTIEAPGTPFDVSKLAAQVREECVAD